MKYLLTHKTISDKRRFLLVWSGLNGLMDRLYSPVAQLVEQVAVNHLVGGSSPSRGASEFKDFGDIAQVLFYLEFPFVNKLLIVFVGIRPH